MNTFISHEGDLVNLESGLVVRKEYARHFREITSGKQLRASLRAGGHTQVGGYQLFYMCDDGAALCPRCVRENYTCILNSIRNGYRDGWRVVAMESTHHCDEPERCENCYQTI